MKYGLKLKSTILIRHWRALEQKRITIKSHYDVTALQNDLGTLEHWSTVSGLSFNQSKCKHQTLTRKKVPVTSSYKLDGSVVSISNNEKDLGVWVSSDLTWKKQVNEQTAKANKILGYIRRNTLSIKNTAARRALYLALVRSHFGYATQIWSPQSVELISKLERTQRRAGTNTWISCCFTKLHMV